MPLSWSKAFRGFLSLLKEIHSPGPAHRPPLGGFWFLGDHLPSSPHLWWHFPSWGSLGPTFGGSAQLCPVPMTSLPPGSLRALALAHRHLAARLGSESPHSTALRELTMDWRDCLFPVTSQSPRREGRSSVLFTSALFLIRHSFAPKWTSGNFWEYFW